MSVFKTYNYNCDAIDVKPVNFDFSEGYTETWDIAFDASREPCDDCSGNGEVECGGCNGTSKVACTECDGTSKVACTECGDIDRGDAHNCWNCDGSGEENCTCDEGKVDCDDCTDGTQDCDTCNGEGIVENDDVHDRWAPMMNYMYSLPITSLPDNVQSKLVSCTIVVVGDEHYIVLTGGGMDLSWEICETYINLGFYPPAHFCDLPKMCGRGDDKEYCDDSRDQRILDACRESLNIVTRWKQGALESLERKFEGKFTD